MAVQGVREAKRADVRRRIADAAATLAVSNGVDGVTADQIAELAGVGRATFFRHYESKELAVATGLSSAGAFVLAEAMARVDPRLDPLDAVRAAFTDLGRDFERHRQMFWDQALLSRTSSAMYAWTLHLYVEWESVVAESVARHLADPAENDPRPRMVGVVTMAAARLACDEWVAADGAPHLPDLIQHHLSGVQIPSSRSHLEPPETP